MTSGKIVWILTICISQLISEPSYGFTLRKESIVGSNNYNNASLDRIKESKNSTDRKGKHLEEYLTCNLILNQLMRIRSITKFQ